MSLVASVLEDVAQEEAEQEEEDMEDDQVQAELFRCLAIQQRTTMKIYLVKPMS
jgi:hypothetical protein